MDVKFSVLMSLYRKEQPQYLEQALKSVFNQTYTASEVVLIIDGPITAELNIVVAKYKNLYSEILIVIPLEKNMGLGYALNKGLKHCSNDIVLRMDTDDICVLNRFEIQYQFMIDNPSVDIVGSWAKDIDIEGNIVGEREYPTDNASLYKLIWMNPFIHPSVAFRKHKIMQIGSYNENISRRQDYDLWFRAAYHKLKFANISAFLLYYRVINKNNLKNTFQIAVIGLKGAYKLRLPAYVYIAVFGPMVLSLLPSFVRKYAYKIKSCLDKRNIL